MPTGQGLVRYPLLDRLAQLAHARPRAIYTERDGLAGKELFRAYEDSRGDVWISTISTARDTLTRWERRTETFHRFTAQDGLPQYNAPTAFGEDAAGNLWIGFYSGGLARYAGGRFTMFAGADGLPAGMIRGIYLDHASRLWVATGEGGVARIDDPAAERPRFGAYNTANGLSSNQATAITEDRWGRIYIGTGRGLDRLDPASGHIRHYTYRVAQLIALERVRTRIATDLHDDIGASLSRVAILSEVVKQTGSLNLRTSQALTQIADSARGLVDSMSDIVWSVDPRRDDLKNVALRVREFAADTLETRGIRWDFTVPPEMERIKLTPEQRRHLFLIFKEAVNNIARHADCANATLSVSVTRRLLLAEIRDDGRGLACDPQRDPGANERGGNGLRNMQARAAELGGELEIASTPGQGTRLMLTIPLP
jgi:signal transduction histidine kinase